MNFSTASGHFPKVFYLIKTVKNLKWKLKKEKIASSFVKIVFSSPVESVRVKQISKTVRFCHLPRLPIGKENDLREDSTNKNIFTDYAISVSLRNKYDGIGIGVFDDICAKDIDHCIKNGVLPDMTENIIARMNNYTAYSPSGTGVRILFKTSLTSYDKE